MKTVLDRPTFLARVQVTDDCWQWLGYTERGYGHLQYRTQHLRAHRVAYQLFVGAIPEGMTVDHLCHNRDTSCLGGVTCPHRRCVNPAHLGVASIAENNARSLAGRPSRKGAERKRLRAALLPTA